MTPVPVEDIERGDGWVVAEFIEEFCRSTRTTIAGPAGSPMRLLPYQHAFLGRLYARRPDGRRRHRMALLGVPRKNGKSGLASGLALYSLVNEDPGAEVLSAAADKEQARIVFAEAKRMVEADPRLEKRITRFRDTLEDKVTGSVYRVLSSEAFTKEGLSGSTVLYDEIHAAPTRELFDVLQLSQGARVDPLFVATTTAGVRTDRTGQESICYQLFQHLVECSEGAVTDEAFVGDWYSDDGPIGSTASDEAANPAYGILVDPEDFDAVKKRTPQAEYLTKRRNVFTATADHWFPEGVFEDRADPDHDLSGRVVLGFDGSWSQDCTALVGATVEAHPHLFVVDVWQRPRDASDHWTVPVGEVEQAIVDACGRFDVVEIAADPSYWRTQLEYLRESGLPVIEFPQQGGQMIEATSSFQQAVVEKRLTHDADPRLVLHVRNCHVTFARGGVKVQKETTKSRRKIDAAVAAIMARHRAAFYAQEPEKIRGVFLT